MDQGRKTKAHHQGVFWGDEIVLYHCGGGLYKSMHVLKLIELYTHDTMIFHYTPIKIFKMQKIDNIKYCQECIAHEFSYTTSSVCIYEITVKL
jgi:hypothetical protein